MALTFTSVIDKGARTWKVAPGLSMSQIDMTTSTGSAGADYSSGFDLQGNAAKMGLTKVFSAIGPVVTEAGVVDGGVMGLFDGTSGKLRFYVVTTGVEITNQIAANGVVRFVVMGV